MKSFGSRPDNAGVKNDYRRYRFFGHCGDCICNDIALPDWVAMGFGCCCISAYVSDARNWAVKVGDKASQFGGGGRAV